MHATARHCSRYAFLRLWHLQRLPFASRYALTLGQYEWHSARNADTVSSHQRSFGIDTRQHNKVRELYEGQTIYALSTGAGRAAIAIIRISGPACNRIYTALCPDQKLPRRRYAALRTLYHPADEKNVLDSDAVVLRFDGPNTATGEDMLELHVHGGPATVKAVMSAISEVDPEAIHAAGPGEFTRRAFDNNKLDLGQIESLGDTLSAETELQRRAALRGRSGELSRIYEEWRHSLIEELSYAAADSDHSEDHSLDMEGIWPRIISKVEKMQRDMILHQQGAQRGSLLRKGIQVSLIGRPNAGKSSLFNLIVGSNASIINEEAGTTRDIVEATVDYNGYRCTFADTAGVRAADNAGNSDIGSIEQEGIHRAMVKAAGADVLIYVASVEPDPEISSGSSSESSPGCSIPFMEDILPLIIGNNGALKPLLVVVNKIDRLSKAQYKGVGAAFIENVRQSITTFLSERSNQFAVTPVFGATYETATALVSATKAQKNLMKESQMNSITEGLLTLFRNMTEMPVESEHLIGVTERQSRLLKSCSTHLGEFLTEAQRNTGPQPDNSIATYHLEQAAKCLAEMTGRHEGAGDVEEILGRVFAKFCIGK
ncbi:related to GTPase MSS1, mitochondrial [Rhynchosporium graminicola]|uniref:Related to GTPase MSS1, mitochondrial n=1 Tax=Rhynchosporium graminicola TaxID=2792576 RepID=A0A1E1KHV2_9HELO|nr:related to GTPase MSS1, mitochondrial [Rhynchosporium commune]